MSAQIRQGMAPALVSSRYRAALAATSRGRRRTPEPQGHACRADHPASAAL